MNYQHLPNSGLALMKKQKRNWPGARIVELFKQASLHRKPVENQIILLSMMKNGYFDEIPVEEIPRLAVELEEFANLHFVISWLPLRPRECWKSRKKIGCAHR
jgi:F0F1-type ATP synthase alpha subunit